MPSREESNQASGLQLALLDANCETMFMKLSRRSLFGGILGAPMLSEFAAKLLAPKSETVLVVNKTAALGPSTAHGFEVWQQPINDDGEGIAPPRFVRSVSIT